jgi:hypothetical protein
VNAQKLAAVSGSSGAGLLENSISHKNGYILLFLLVGAARFELTTPCAQGRCATRLRYAPTFAASLILNHFLDFRYRPACPNRSKTLSTVTTP